MQSICGSTMIVWKTGTPCSISAPAPVPAAAARGASDREEERAAASQPAPGGTTRGRHGTTLPVVRGRRIRRALPVQPLVSRQPAQRSAAAAAARGPTELDASERDAQTERATKPRRQQRQMVVCNLNTVVGSLWPLTPLRCSSRSDLLVSRCLLFLGRRRPLAPQLGRPGARRRPDQR
jgi:hypothetical protein